MRYIGANKSAIAAIVREKAIILRGRRKTIAMKTKVAIVAGGNSSEYEVSLRSAGNIKNTLDKNLYDAVIVLIHGDKWQAVVSDTEKYDIDKNDFSYADADGKHVFDFAYITIHGTPGENGIVQGYFELLGMKYSCCGVLAAALTFNKYMCNRYLESVGANPAPAVWLHKGEEADPEKIIAVTGLPCFVKSNVSGSSFGVSKVARLEDVGAAVANAFAEGDEVIVESFLKGTEVTCGIYKTKDKTVVLPLTEVVSKNEFFDFNAKYNGQSEEITPARLDAALTADIQARTSRYYDALDCKGLVRIDYIITEDGIPHVLEVNTTPGMTDTSFIPQQVRAAGLSLTDVFTDIIEDAKIR